MEGENPLPPEQEQVGIANKPEVPKTKESEKLPLDALLVFGQGPVIERETKERASDVGKEQGSEDVNLWSRELAKAASELYKRGQMREIIVMGGRTGGETYQSEAGLIAKLLVENGVPNNVIRLENQSTNTLENLVNTLNEYLDATDQYGKVGILTSNYHLSRTRLLMQLFNIPYKNAFSAEEVLRFIAREGKEWEKWDQGKLLEIERRLNMGEANKTPVSQKDSEAWSRYGYYQTQKGTEQKDVTRRGQEEDIWSRALLEIPEYWIGYLGRLNNTNRIREVLAKQDQTVLKERFGIDLSQDTDTILKERLISIERKLPNVEEWLGREWGPPLSRFLMVREDVNEKVSSSLEVEKPRTRVFVMRHGPTTFNKENRVQGKIDTDIVPAYSVPLFERIGAKDIPKPDVIVVSGLKRTRQTADALREYLGWTDTEIIVNDGFSERRWGVMEGLTHPQARDLLLQDEELVKMYPYLKTEEALKTVWEDPTFKASGGGESLEDVAVRVRKAFNELYNIYPNKNVLLVTHAGVLQTQELDFEKVSQLNLSQSESGDLSIQKVE